MSADGDLDLTGAASEPAASLVWSSTYAHTLGLRSATQHGNTRGARCQYRALRRGPWIEAILTATAS